MTRTCGCLIAAGIEAALTARSGALRRGDVDPASARIMTPVVVSIRAAFALVTPARGPCGFTSYNIAETGLAFGCHSEISG